jgi:hypothetical protein
VEYYTTLSKVENEATKSPQISTPQISIGL